MARKKGLDKNRKLSEKDNVEMILMYLNRKEDKWEFTDNNNRICNIKTKASSETDEAVKKILPDELANEAGFPVKIEVSDSAFLVTADSKGKASKKDKLKEIFDFYGFKPNKKGVYIYNKRKAVLVEEKNRYGIQIEQHLDKYSENEENGMKRTTVSDVMDNVESGEYNLEHSCQRKQDQWPDKMKGEFIESILHHVLINPIIIAKINGIKYVIDGKQRLTTLREFIPREGKEAEKSLQIFGEKLTYDELTKNEKKMLNGYNLQIYNYNLKSDADVNQLFNLYNNQAPLTGEQKLKSHADKAVLEKLQGAIKHPFLVERSGLNKGDINRDSDIAVLIRSAMLVYYGLQQKDDKKRKFELKGFSSTDTRKFVEFMNDMPEDEIEELFSILHNKMDILNSFIPEKQKDQKNKALKKGNLPYIIASASDDDAYKKHIEHFMYIFDNNTDEYKKFKKNSTDGTTTKTSVERKYDYFNNY